MTNGAGGPTHPAGTGLTRRDFLGDTALTVCASLVPGGCELPVGASGHAAPQDLPGHYLPALTGRRGSHPGSFEAAHSLRDVKVLPVYENVAVRY